MAHLSTDQKREVCTIAAVGCDRQIAARYLGRRPAEVEAAIESDPAFARDLAQAEARAELIHMGNVKEAAQEEKNWRASVWWLERRAPDRYGRRDAGAITPAQLRRFIEALSAIIADEVRHAADRERMLRRLAELETDIIDASEVKPNATVEPPQAGNEDDAEL